jgi:drug/metabolite transporter (DMT)-like permease
MNLAISVHAPADNLRGIAAMLASMASLIANDALIKIAAASLPTGEVIFLRGLFATSILIGLMLWTGAMHALPRIGDGKMLLRSVAEIGATLLYLSALVRMPIAEATAVLQFTPLAITAGAALFLGAQVGWRRWSATVVGLAGVMLIIRPGADVFNPYASLALLAILFIAARDLITRGLAKDIPTLLIAFASSASVALASTGFLLVEQWEWPALPAAIALAGASIGLLGGQYWIIVAMRTGDIAVVAPFRYSIILWAIVAGFLIWRELPDPATWAGIAIVTAAGLYTFLREHRLARAARA